MCRCTAVGAVPQPMHSVGQLQSLDWCLTLVWPQGQGWLPVQIQAQSGSEEEEVWRDWLLASTNAKPFWA